MSLSRKQILSLIFFLAVLFALPVAVFLTQKRQDIRPRALQGKANLLMSSDKNSAAVGESINVLVTMQLVGSDLQVSGVDFMILYDKEKLDVINITPTLQNVIDGGFFTDAPVVTSGGKFDDTYNFLRVVEVAKTANNNLPTGSLSLANITFRSIGEGTAVVKFPEDNKYIEIVGLGMMPPAGPSGLVGWWKMESAGDARTQQLNLGIRKQSQVSLPVTPENYVDKYKISNFVGIMSDKTDSNLVEIYATVKSINTETQTMELAFELPGYLKDQIKNTNVVTEQSIYDAITVKLDISAKIYDDKSQAFISWRDSVDNFAQMVKSSYIGSYVKAEASVANNAELIIQKLMKAYVL